MTCQISSGSDNVGTPERFQDLLNLIIMSQTDWLMLLPSESQSNVREKLVKAHSEFGTCRHLSQHTKLIGIILGEVGGLRPQTTNNLMGH